MEGRVLVAILVVLAAMAGACGRAEEEVAVSLIGTWEGRWQGKTGSPECTSDRVVMEIFEQRDGQFQARVDGGCAGSFLASGELKGDSLKLEGTAAAGAITYTGSVHQGVHMEGRWQITGSPDYKGTWEVAKISDRVAAPGSPTPTATSPAAASPTVAVTPTPRGTPAATAEEAFPGVPVPRDAVLESSVRITGPLPAPIPLPPGVPAVWEMKTYNVPRPPRQVADFYKNVMSQGGWSSTFAMETETPEYQAGFVFERAEAGKQVTAIVWIEASDNKSSLVIWRSSQ